MKSAAALLILAMAAHACAPAQGGEAESPVKTPALCPQIAQAAPNTWVKLDEGMLKDGKRLGAGLTYIPSDGKFLLTGNPGEAKIPAEMLFDPATGKWEEAKPGQAPWRGLRETSCFPAWDPAANKGYAYLGASTKRLVCFDYAQKTWTELPSKSAPPSDNMYNIAWSSVCWLPDGQELMLANGSGPLKMLGTWLYKPATSEWRHLSFGSALINGRRADADKLYVKAQDLVAFCRNRHYRAETEAAAKVDLAKAGADLASALRALAKTLSADQGADDYEKQQLSRAAAALEKAAKLAEEQAAKLGGALTPAILQALEDGVAETVRAARDELAAEPPPRCNSPLVWHPSGKKVVMFGGDGHSRAYADTWVFDPAALRWTQKRPPVAPEPRAGHCLLWAPKAKTVVMVGRAYAPNQGRGRQGLYETLPFEMWKYDLAKDAWSLIRRCDDKSAPPAEMCGTDNSVFAVNENDLLVGFGRTGFYGSDVKISTWACRLDAAPTDVEGTAKFGVGPGAVAFFGGTNSYDRMPAEDQSVTEARLKNLPANTWTLITTANSGNPGGWGNWGTCVLDTDSDQFFWWRGGHAGYCGNDVAHYSIRSNTWSLSYRRSHPLSFESSCGGIPGTDFDGRPWQGMHTYHRCGYDPAVKKMAMLIYRTYTYDPARRAWDAANFENKVSNFVLTPHGMMASSRGDRVKFFRLDLANGAGWVEMPTKGTMPSVCGYSSAVVYDSKRDRLYCGYGVYGSVKVGEVWCYDIKTGEASELKAKNAEKVKPWDESGREALYLPDADIVLFDVGGPDWNYVYDPAKNEWKSVRLKPRNISQGGLGNGLMYDPKRKLIYELAHSDSGYKVWALRFDPATAEYAELK